MPTRYSFRDLHGNFTLLASISEVIKKKAASKAILVKLLFICTRDGRIILSNGYFMVVFGKHKNIFFCFSSCATMQAHINQRRYSRCNFLHMTDVFWLVHEKFLNFVFQRTIMFRMRFIEDIRRSEKLRII